MLRRFSIIRLIGKKGWIGMRLFRYLSVMLLAVSIAGCMNTTSLSPTAQETLSPTDLEPKEKPGESITLSAVGDILIHDRVYEAAEVDDGYDFEPMVENMQPYLNDSDITFANQETMIGGEGLGLSGYPAFNRPVEIGETLKDSGVDIVSIANNHSLDRGEEAIQESIKHWNDMGMTYVGAYKNK